MLKVSIRRGLAVLAAALFLVSGTIRADQPGTDEQSRKSEAKAAWDEAEKVAVQGPATVDLRDQAKLTLPDHTAFIPNPQASRVMRALGNTVDADFIGLAVGQGNWLATIDFIKEGYIKDDDAKNWNVDDLLDGLKKGTEAANEDRKDRGFPALTLDGWIEKPNYDPTRHTLVWSVGGHDEGADPKSPQTVNYNTYLLGRDGYLSLDFITGSDEIAAGKPTALALLNGLSFVPGKRYSDFNSNTDKIAAYGLAALVGGVVAKKLGLLALIGVFLAKFAKVGLVIAAGGLVAARKFFGRLFRRNDA